MNLLARSRAALRILLGRSPAALASARGPQVRMYHAAKNSRLTSGWNATQSSSDAELHSSLRTLRGRSRSLIRDNAYAKRAKAIVVNNVIGTGVGIQAQAQNNRGRLLDDVNSGIEDVFYSWGRAEYCHTGGALDFQAFEQALMGQVFEAGEVLVRRHLRSFGGSPVPYALEMIEAERIADEYAVPFADGANEIRMGVEVDKFQRAVAYWLRERHPGDLRAVSTSTDNLIRVPAEQIWHLRIVTRWPQVRGEPWMHAVMRTLNDIDGYSEAEIVAARAAACYMGFIETPDGNNPLADAQTDPAAPRDYSMEAGTVEALAAGEKFQGYSPTRPNAAMADFLRHMLRQASSGMRGVTYETLSGDYSQSNYSSSRLGVIDSRDEHRVLQRWWIRNFRELLHAEWLRQAVYAGAIPAISIAEYVTDPMKFTRAKFQPRGWTWIDPSKDVDASLAAIKGGLTTMTDVIDATNGGADIEETLKTRRRELDLMADIDLVFETSPEAYMAKAAPPPAPAPKEPAAPKPDAAGDQAAADDPARARVHQLR